MGYVPNNGSVFTAAYTGAMAGMATGGGRVPRDTNPAAYGSIAAIAGAWAQSFDTIWGVNPANGLELGLIEDACYGAWDTRVGPLNATNLNASNWSSECQAIVANILSSDAYYAGQGITPPAASAGGGRTLPALDGANLLAWDFQLLNTNLPPALGSAQQPYKSTGTVTGATSDLASGFQNSGGGSVAALGPGGNGLALSASFFTVGGVTGGQGTGDNPPATPDNSPTTIEAYFNLLALNTSSQGVIFSKVWGPTWAAPFNALEMNLTAGGTGAVEFGMTDSASPGTEIGQTISGRDALLPGFHHAALVVDQLAKRVRMYVDGYQRGFFTYTGGLSNGTGPWIIGGNQKSTNDSSNIAYSRVTVSSIARTADYIAKAAAGYLRS